MSRLPVLEAPVVQRRVGSTMPGPGEDVNSWISSHGRFNLAGVAEFYLVEESGNPHACSHAEPTWAVLERVAFPEFDRGDMHHNQQPQQYSPDTLGSSNVHQV